METATITGAKRDIVTATNDGFIDVQVTYDLDGTIEVMQYAYPLTITREEIEADIKVKLATRASDRESMVQIAQDAEDRAEREQEEKQADETVAMLEGLTVS